MWKYVYLILLTGLLGCQDDRSGHANYKKSPVKLNMIDTANQYIDSVKLNGVINAKDNLNNVLKYLGQPDSVSRYYYTFKGVLFLNIDHTLVLNEVKVAKFHDLYLQTTKLRMNYATTIDDFKKYYPKYANDELGGSDMDRTIAIAIPQKVTKDIWFFYFDRNSGKLLNIVFEMPE